MQKWLAGAPSAKVQQKAECGLIPYRQRMLVRSLSPEALNECIAGSRNTLTAEAYGVTSWCRC
jgi:hypothetical protein